jgi:hypothetical protein
LASDCSFSVGENEKKTEIKECSAEEKEGEGGIREGGMGGGIFLYCFDDSSSFLFQNIQFDENSAEKGKNLFINSKELETVIKETKIKFLIKNDEKNEYMGFDQRNEGRFIPLLLFFSILVQNNFFHQK